MRHAFRYQDHMERRDDGGREETSGWTGGAMRGLMDEVEWSDGE